jgi:hypothetical protein
VTSTRRAVRRTMRPVVGGWQRWEYPAGLLSRCMGEGGDARDEPRHGLLGSKTHIKSIVVVERGHPRSQRALARTSFPAAPCSTQSIMSSCTTHVRRTVLENSHENHVIVFQHRQAASGGANGDSHLEVRALNHYWLPKMLKFLQILPLVG